MFTIRIEHSVPEYDSWKRAFDDDPADRKGSGVRRYRVSRSVTDPNQVLIDLDFEDVDAARRMLASLQKLWAGPAAGIVVSPHAVIVEQVEDREL